MRLLIPAFPFAVDLERDDLGPLWGITFGRDCGLQFHFGERSLIICREDE